MDTPLHRLAVAVLVLGCTGSRRSVDGYMYQFISDCEYNDHLEDFLYTRRNIFNKIEIYRYDSNIQKFVGYTPHGIKNAERFNQDKEYLAGLKDDLDNYCKHNAGVYKSTMTDRKVPPSVKVSATKLLSSKHPTMLVCHVTGFYPQRIRVTWLRDGLETKTDVTSTDLLANGDWTYQVHSHLELTPRAGETVACRVEHSSLERPLEVTWDPSMPESKKNKIVIGVSGLILGLIITAAGVIYYKKKSSGRILVPSD
ncbi:HLA class II histocompatibility antigen, DQ beta 1 chain-like [Lepisosteus oculatus]|uniref:HLA class II histocompatibility antigen, DQ beta 1 chain-like n=1 Tax=Lepisosteus oculatus TaxID=7918 RepID=UPI0035F50F87